MIGAAADCHRQIGRFGQSMVHLTLSHGSDTFLCLGYLNLSRQANHFCFQIYVVNVWYHHVANSLTLVSEEFIFACLARSPMVQELMACYICWYCRPLQVTHLLSLLCCRLWNHELYWGLTKSLDVSLAGIPSFFAESQVISICL